MPSLSETLINYAPRLYGHIESWGIFDVHQKEALKSVTEILCKVSAKHLLRPDLSVDPTSLSLKLDLKDRRCRQFVFGNANSQLEKKFKLLRRTIFAKQDNVAMAFIPIKYMERGATKKVNAAAIVRFTRTPHNELKVEIDCKALLTPTSIKIERQGLINIDIFRKNKQVYEDLKGCPHLVSSVFAETHYMNKKLATDFRPFILQTLFDQDLFQVLVGDSKEQVTQRGTLLSPKQQFHIIYSIAEALQYIHSQKYTLRDLKPENIVIRKITDKDDTRLDVGVIDFEHALRLDNERLKTTAPPTFCYIPPEYFEREGFDEPNLRSDIWSLGMIVLQITGKCKRAPIHKLIFEYDYYKDLLKRCKVEQERKQIQEIMTELWSQWQLALSDIREGDPTLTGFGTDFWGRLLLRMLQPNPKERISADELLVELKNYEL